jgi:hypothetical protein
VYNRIAILGVGTLGGFIAETIVENEFCKELLLFDHDIVEQKNIVNSIYREVDVGDFKVDALKEILNKVSSSVNIIPKCEMFIEGETPIDVCNLVLDCRDVTYSRGNLIDCRLNISSRYLIVDCRRNIIYKEHINGRYITPLSRIDVKSTSLIFSNLLDNGVLLDLIKNQSVQKYDLDYFKSIDLNRCDVLYESEGGEEKLIDLPQNLLPIIEKNRTEDLTVVVGSRVHPLSQRTIPKMTLTSSNEIVKNLLSMVQDHCQYNNFIVTVKNNYIELVPETGAA